jgi:hypothetical protein
MEGQRPSDPNGPGKVPGSAPAGGRPVVMSNKNVVGHPAPQASEGLVSEKQLSKAFVATVDLAPGDKPPAGKAASTHSQTLEPPGGALVSGDMFPEGAWLARGTGEPRRRTTLGLHSQSRHPFKAPRITPVRSTSGSWSTR